VKTQFGAHLINVQEKTKVSNKARIASLVKPIEASVKTNEAVFAQANDFAVTSETNEAFQKNSKEKNLFVVKVPTIRPTDRNVNDLNNSRELVNWAFNEATQINDVSKVMEFEGKYVVAALTGKRDKGIPALEQIKEDLEAPVKREKKADQFVKEMQPSGATSIDALAMRLKLSADVQSTVTFGSYSVPNYGYEPKLIGTISASKAAKLSEPVRGNSGVYVYVVETVTEAPAPPADLKEYKKSLAANLQGRVDNGVYSSMLKKAKVDDKRYRYF
jgi:peptidyl-prolyl cis-trans isomerase D